MAKAPGLTDLASEHLAAGRDIGVSKPMSHSTQKPRSGSKTVEFLIPLALLGLCFVLQAWVLPRFGVKT
jgi:hypothetical protein